MTNSFDASNQVPVQPEYGDRRFAGPLENSASAVSWAAIFAGAIGAAALAMILLMLGAGLGLSSVSPWEDHGLQASTVGKATIGWLIFTQIAASGMGGYLAGRLRTRWAATHVDEIYFRDTAHGFLAWAVAALISAVLLTSTLGAIVGGGAKAVGSVAGGAASTSANVVSMDAPGMSGSSMGYFVHSLFRTTANSSATDNASAAGTAGMPGAQPQNPAVTPSQLGEVTGIFANSLRTGALSPEDQQYVAQLVAQHTGMSQKDAEARVQAVYGKVQSTWQDAKTEAKKAANAARKTAIHLTLWTFISLLIGAFVASLCATFGGRQRDL